MSAPELRASDAEREVTVTRLSTHAAEGRLDADELEERVEAALAAQTADELTRLEADLPPLQTAGRSRPSGPTVSRQVRAYIAVMALLVTIWALTGADYFWPVWPALGWGVGLLTPGGCHARRRAQGRRLTEG